MPMCKVCRNKYVKKQNDICDDCLTAKTGVNFRERSIELGQSLDFAYRRYQEISKLNDKQQENSAIIKKLSKENHQIGQQKTEHLKLLGKILKDSQSMKV